MTINQTDIGKRIRTALTTAGKTQRDLAAALHISESSVSAYIKGSSEPSAIGWMTISTLCGVSIDYLITGDVKQTTVAHSDPQINEMAEQYMGKLPRKPLDRRAEQIIAAYQYLAENNEELAQRVYEDAVEALLMAKLKG